MSKYCSSCGETNDDDALFCCKCGFKFEVQGAPPTVSLPTYGGPGSSGGNDYRLPTKYDTPDYRNFNPVNNGGDPGVPGYEINGGYGPGGYNNPGGDPGVPGYEINGGYGPGGYNNPGGAPVPARADTADNKKMNIIIIVAAVVIGVAVIGFLVWFFAFRDKGQTVPVTIASRDNTESSAAETHTQSGANKTTTRPATTKAVTAATTATTVPATIQDITSAVAPGNMVAQLCGNGNTSFVAKTKTTTVDGVNMRDTPDISGSVVTTISYARVINISQINNGWGYTSYTANGKVFTGWVFLDYVETSYTTPATISLYRQAQDASDVICQVNAGTQFTLRGVTGNMALVSYGGQLGYVQLSSLMSDY